MPVEPYPQWARNLGLGSVLLPRQCFGIHTSTKRVSVHLPDRPKRKSFSPPNRPRSRIDMRLRGPDAVPETSRRRPPTTLSLWTVTENCLFLFFFAHFHSLDRGRGPKILDTFHTHASCPPSLSSDMGGIFKDRASLAQIAHQSIVT